jgi:hypothetical protein
VANPLPQSRESLPSSDGAHAAAHLASLRAALRAADLIAGKSSEQASAPIEITEVWADLPPAAQRVYQARSTRAARAAGRGLEVVASQPVKPAAADVLSDWLRADLARIEQLFAGR